MQSGGNTSDEEGGRGAKEDSESEDVTEEDFDEFGIDDDLMKYIMNFKNMHLMKILKQVQSFYVSNLTEKKCLIKI